MAVQLDDESVASFVDNDKGREHCKEDNIWYESFHSYAIFSFICTLPAPREKLRNNSPYLTVAQYVSLCTVHN